MKLSASEAAQVCNVSERTIRRMIAEQRLQATPAAGPRVARETQGKQIGPSRWSIDIDDLARCPGLVINRERLADLEAQTGKGSIAARMDRLEAENRLLRTRLDIVERQVRRLTPTDGQEAAYAPVDLAEYHPAPVAASERPARREYATTMTSELPPGYMPLATFAEHNEIAVTTLRKAVESGRLAGHHAAAEGIADGWKHGRARVQWALDEGQQAAALALYGRRA